jgi:hypothetical protein
LRSIEVRCVENGRDLVAISLVTMESSAKQVAGFIAKFTPEMQKQIRAARRAMRQRLPTAVELVYDSFLVMAFSPTERPWETVCSLAADKNGISLCFLRGKMLTDPHKILRSRGKQAREVRLEDAGTLQRPEIEALLKAAVGQSETRFPESGRGKTVIRPVSAKQRARR